jgi:uncharacterized protein (DUF983 family)
MAEKIHARQKGHQMTLQTFAGDDLSRDTKQAVKNGLRCKCPRCGEGALFSSYLKVQANCPSCGLDLTPQRADDGPAYVVILIVCHVVGITLGILWENFRMEPMMMVAILSTLAIVLSLALLPPTKGFFVAMQWANRMHGFGGATA